MTLEVFVFPQVNFCKLLYASAGRPWLFFLCFFFFFFFILSYSDYLCISLITVHSSFLPGVKGNAHMHTSTRITPPISPCYRKIISGNTPLIMIHIWVIHNLGQPQRACVTLALELPSVKVMRMRPLCDMLLFSNLILFISLMFLNEIALHIKSTGGLSSVCKAKSCTVIPRLQSAPD